MAGKQAKENQIHIVASLRHVAAPDAGARLSRAMEILLKSATIDNIPQPEENSGAPKGKQPTQVPRKDALTGGGDGQV